MHLRTKKNTPGADVVVGEILGALLLGEGALDYLRDARRLLKPGGRVSPQIAALLRDAHRCNHSASLPGSNEKDPLSYLTDEKFSVH